MAVSSEAIRPDVLSKARKVYIKNEPVDAATLNDAEFDELLNLKPRLIRLDAHPLKLALERIRNLFGTHQTPGLTPE